MSSEAEAALRRHSGLKPATQTRAKADSNTPAPAPSGPAEEFTRNLANANMSMNGKALNRIMLSGIHMLKQGDLLPQYSSGLTDQDPALFRSFLREAPQQVIRFRDFTRTDNSILSEETKKPLLQEDSRLLRIKNKARLPRSVWARWVVNHRIFTTAVLVGIFLNAVVLGLQTELDEAEHWEFLMFLDIVDESVLLLFIFEIVLKWIDNFWMFWKDPWNLFDFAVTSASALPELFIFLSDSVIASFTGSSSSFSQGASVQFLAKAARQLRVIRSFRSLKLITRFRSLRVIVQTILDTFQSVIYIVTLLVLLMFIYAIFSIYLFEEYTDWPDAQHPLKFKDIINCYMTLFQMLTLDQWYGIMNDVRLRINLFFSLVFFISWVWFGAFVFRNIFVGVMVRNFQNTSSKLHDSEMERRERKKMQLLFRKLHKNLKAAKQEQGKPDDDFDENDHTMGGAESAQSYLEHMERTQDALEDAIASNLTALGEGFSHETLWPRDTQIRYLMTLERLEENRKEYRELLQLAAMTLHQSCATK